MHEQVNYSKYMNTNTHTHSHRCIRSIFITIKIKKNLITMIVQAILYNNSHNKNNNNYNKIFSNTNYNTIT